MKVEIKHNVEQVRRELKLTGKELLKATVRATNKTLTTVRKDTSQALRKEYAGLKAAQIKARIGIRRATQRNPVGYVAYSGRRFSVYGNFGMRGVGDFGVRFRRLPWRLETPDGDKVTPEMLRRAFRQRTGSGGRAGVWARAGKARYPINLLLAPGLARAYTERHIDRALKASVGKRFPVALRQEAMFVVSKRK